MTREEHYVGRRAMEMKVQGRRKRGRPKRRWLNRLRDDIKKGLLDDELVDHAIKWRRMSSYIDPTFSKKNSSPISQSYLSKIYDLRTSAVANRYYITLYALHSCKTVNAASGIQFLYSLVAIFKTNIGRWI